MRRILEVLGSKTEGSSTIYCDNNSTIKLSKNPVLHDRSKLIDVRFHFVRDLIKEGTLELVHYSSQEQLADILTKALKVDQFEFLRDHMGMVNCMEVS